MTTDLASRIAHVEAMPKLSDQLQSEGLWARKSFGQHFLLDLNLTRRIVREAGLTPAINAIEIGPGPGGLTRALVEADLASVTAIERDERFVAFQQPLVDACDGFFRVISADALTVNLVEAVPAPRAIVANLPYNVGTPMLINWLGQMPEFHSLTLMFQREVADRIAAATGSKAYGRLSVLAQLCANVSYVMTIPARAFTPPPKIDSAVVRLTPREPGLSREEFSALEKVTAAAFGQRRKMLRSSLKTVFDDPVAALEELDIKPTARAEEIAPPDFLRIAQMRVGTTAG